MTALRILVVEDEELQRVALSDELRELGHDVRECGDADAALGILVGNPPQVVVSDIKMPGMSGIDLLARIKESWPWVTVIMVTAFSDVATAVRAMKMGAEDYLTKPFDVEELDQKLRRIARSIDLEARNDALTEQLRQTGAGSKMIGESVATEKLREQLQHAARSSATVLLEGETGTGKELAATIIHEASDRRDGPMIRVSCAALAREVLESELFGHEQGAFTGAMRTRMGRFELANGGTIFLDEVDDVPLEVQVKLLRVLEERSLERVGSAKAIPIDVRVIAATKRDLRELVGRSEFREDLYYRLHVLKVPIPPLRERGADAALLFCHFLRQQLGERAPAVESGALERICAYDWPGNVRQLRNEAERLSISCTCAPVRVDCLSDEIQRPTPSQPHESTALDDDDLPQAIARFEEKRLREAIVAADGKRSEAARLLGIPATTLKSKLRKYEID